jgi:hypothetical protein
MKLNKLLFFILISLLITSCSGGGGGGGSSAPTVTLTSIAVTPVNPSILSDATRQFTATGTYSDSSTRDITTSVTWNSSNTAVATISNISGSRGLASAVAGGTTTITASSGSVSGSTDLTVIAVTLTSIEVTPVNPGIALGATQQFTATGTYSDSSIKNITTSVTWSSDDTAVATISNISGSNGLAASLAAGTATITANSGGISGSTLLTVNSTPMDNVMRVTVNGSLCSSAYDYPNKPCVSVTVCAPGTSNCKTINDILLDTGSVGLRIFKSLLTGISLTPVASGGGSLADCIQYVDGSAHWGPVQIADVILGNEKALSVPIHIIDAAFGSVPASCGTPDATPADSRFNGILGAGLSTEDCGPGCTSSQDPMGTNGMYYSCNGSSCSGTAVSLGNQVQNPISMLTNDNNGFIVRLPAVPAGGAVSADGLLILGIGTRSNNVVSVTNAFSTNSAGDFTTVFNSRTYSDSFMDSGSNGLFLNRSSVSALATCGSLYSGWYCPSSTLSLSATMAGHSVPFKIGDSSNLLSPSNPNYVFSELGGTYTSFDWGLPFFLGRSVYVLIDGNNVSGLGTGPYLAY